MITDIYDYSGPARVKHDDHIYYDEFVITSELVGLLRLLIRLSPAWKSLLAGGRWAGCSRAMR